MLENVIKKLFPIRDEEDRPCTFPTFASQVFFNDGSVLEGKQFGGGTATVDPLTIYPVGSIYMSVNSTSPAILFGGTWEQLKDRFLLGAGDSYTLGSKGGKANVSLTDANVTSNGTLLYYTYDNAGDAIPAGRIYITNGNWGYSDGVVKGYTNAFGPSRTGTPHDNMPPYEAVNMWKRVA